MTTGKSSLIVFVLVVADARKLLNFSIGSISHYIAVLTLSRPASLDGCEALPRIIDLMSPICGATSDSTAITAGDTAYLRALYPLDLEQPRSLQRNDIQNKMMRELETNARGLNPGEGLVSDFSVLTASRGFALRSSELC